MNEAFDKVGTAVGEGMDYVEDAFGGEIDKDLRRYDSLNKDTFEKMTHKYGIAKVTDYVKAMEARRMGVGAKK